ncbi:hypothetical protein [Mycobacterium intracellulare]|jgi:hypothetical protein|uniref:hypothetical protein n=1 Tax=Mycobacterium intracellulare TaxID=1767 RepID=UPI0015DFCACE|nr:hypothetical protein [Mycobacterium intracellulare]
MSTPQSRWLAAAPNYLPHYTHTQQITGTAVLTALAVIAVVTFIIIQCRRRR